MSILTTESPTAFVAAHVPPTLRDELVELARANERTISAELRLAIRRHLETSSPDRPAATRRAA